jgi:hypothetical protein
MAKSNVANPVQACLNNKIKANANIVSVEFLDGDDDSILKGTGEQFVNLPAENKWVDGFIVKNKDRLSCRPRIKVVFDIPGSHIFWLKLEEYSDNAKYSDTEKKRNSKFVITDLERQFITRTDGKKIVDGAFNLTVAGNNLFSAIAKDKNGKTVKTTGNLKTTRYFYFVEIKMKGLTSIANNLSAFESEFDNNYFKIKSLPSVEIDHIENIDASNTKDTYKFVTAVNKAFRTSTGPDKSPHCVAVAYTDHLAEKLPHLRIRKKNQTVGPGRPPVRITIMKGSEIKCLWQNIVLGEDWFISCTFIKKNGIPFKDTIHIDKIKCSPLPTNINYQSYAVSIDVSELPASEGTITLKVNCVDSMNGGLSFNEGNIICLCTRSWWTNESNLDQNQVLIHEMGHKIGMVADGLGISPDKVISLYGKYSEAPTHVGNHCHHGIPDSDSPFDDIQNLLKSKCVMYGATNNITTFCENCKMALRRIDITNGW